MFFWLIALFVAMPLIELALLIRVAQAIELLPTVGLVILTGIVGASLARSQGLRTWNRVQQDLAAGRMPTSEIVDGLLILVAGVVLITPGILTDAIGFALLVPPIRSIIKRRLADHFRARVVTIRPDAYAGDGFIDVEAKVVAHEPGGGDP